MFCRNVALHPMFSKILYLALMFYKSCQVLPGGITLTRFLGNVFNTICSMYVIILTQVVKHRVYV